MDAELYADYRVYRKKGLSIHDAHVRAKGWRAFNRECKRIQAWNAAHPIVRIGRTPDCAFTLAEIRKWKVDRSSGFLRVVRANGRKPSPTKQLADLRVLIAAHGTPELVALIQARGLAA